MGIFFDAINNTNANKTPANAAGASHLNPFEKDDKNLNNLTLNKTIDFLKSDTGVNKMNLFTDLEKDLRDEIVINSINTEEELNKVRAENQSVFEQAGNALMQMGLNEVVLGTALGFSNMVDFFANIGKDAGKDDYTNIVSTELENLRNEVKDRFEIYRKNPNATWAIGDFGWWADNFVSVASTASMLIPTMSVTAGLGAIAKLGRLGKITRGIAKGFNKVGLSKYPNILAQQMNAGVNITTNALLSRTMEGYLEAREVYNLTYNNTLKAIKEMTPEEKNTLFINNPTLLNSDMNDEEIASHIASVSTDKTFKNDYAMLLFDIAQFKAISSLWKGANKTATATERIANQNAIKNLSKEATETLKNTGFISKQKEALKGMFRNPMTSIAAVEWSEGLEEGYQGIQTEKGQEVAKKILDPNFKGRSIDSYLTDGTIWEQAFWGVLGGVGFQVAGKGLGKLKKAITKEYDKKRLSEKDFNIKHTAEETARTFEINNRINKMKFYASAMEQLNAGKNPFANMPDEFGNIYKDKLTFAESEKLKSKLTNEFKQNMVLDAADAGNWELFKEFINSKEFKQFFDDNKIANGQSIEAFTQTLLNDMNQIYEDYLSTLHTVLGSSKVESQYVARLAARDIIRRKSILNDLYNTKNDLISEITQNYNHANTDKYKQKDVANLVNSQFKELDAEENNYKKLLKDKKITKAAYDTYLDSINKERTRLINYFSKINPNIVVVEDINDNNEFIAEFNKFIKTLDDKINKITNEYYEAPPNAAQALVMKLNSIENTIDMIETSLPESNNDYQQLYDDLALANDSNVITKYNEAADRVSKWIESQKDINKAKEDIFTNNVPKNIEKDLQILKIGHENTQVFTDRINDVVQLIKENKKEKKQKANEVKVNNNITKPTEAESIKQTVDAVDNQATTINNKPYTKDTNGEWFEVGDEIEGTNYDIDGNISKQPNSVWRAKIIKVYDNGAIKIEGGAEFTPTMIREFFGLPVNQIKGATSRFTYNSRLGKPRVQSSPSTGVETKTSSVDDNLKGQLTKEDIDEIAQTSSAEIKAAEEIRKGFADDVNNVIKLNNQVRTIATELFNNDESLKINMIGKDNKSEEFNKFYNAVKEKIVTDGDFNPDENSIRLATLQILNVLNRKYASKTQEELANKINNVITTPINEQSTIKNYIEDFINKYIEARLNNQEQSSKGEYVKTVINIPQLFKYLINEGIIDNYTAKLLINSLNSYIYQSNTNYIFTDINKLSDIDTFMQQLVVDTQKVKHTINHMHISAPSFRLKKDATEKDRENLINKKRKYEDAINAIKNGDKIQVNQYGNSLSFSVNGVEIGYVGTVSTNTDGTKFYLTNYPNRGFLYQVSANNDNTFSSNTDEFFNNLIYQTDDKYKKLYELIDKYYTNKIALDNNQTSNQLTENEQVELFDLMFELAKDIYVITDTNNKKDKLKQVNNILEDLSSILFYDVEFISPDFQKLSYNNWIESIYHNYKNTHDLQLNIAENKDKKTIVTLSGMDMTTALYNDNNQQPIENLAFDPIKNPIICNIDGELVCETIDRPYINKAGFSIGTMGLLINDNANAPIIAKFTKGNELKNNSKLANLVYKEIVNLLTNFQNKTISYDELYSSLVQLLNSPQNKTHNLFLGYNVIESNNRIILNIAGEDKINLIIHKFKKDSTDKGVGITYIKDGDSNKITTSIAYDKNIIKEIAKEIVSNLTFNRTFYPIINRFNENTSDNKYMYKQDGEFIIDIGGDINRYNSFTEFAIKENAFITNQQQDKYGNFFSLNDKINSLYINIDQTTSPVEGIESINTPSDVIKSDTGNGVNVVDIVNASRIPLNKKEILLSLFPDKVYFDRIKQTIASAYHKNGKIYITNVGVASMNSPQELIRLLLHENIHKLLNENNIIDRNNIVKELLDTYNQFIAAIEQDNTNLGIQLKKWVKNNKFNPTDYFSKLTIEEQNEWKNKSQSERDRYFVEEWLVESLSQPELVNYLNRTKYNEKVVIDNLEDNKTIFQKIIEILLKLFGKDIVNIQNNTILAKQYSILGENIVPDNSTNNTEIVDDNKPGQTPIDNNYDSSEETADLFSEEELDEDTSSAIENYSVVESIASIDETNIENYREDNSFNGNGIVNIQNMDSYTRRFPIQDQPLISKMVAENQLKFVC